jgi:hypothetical protein
VVQGPAIGFRRRLGPLVRGLRRLRDAADDAKIVHALKARLPRCGQGRIAAHATTASETDRAIAAGGTAPLPAA